MLCPGQAVGAGGVADGVWLVLFAARVPKAEALGAFIPDHVRAHDSDLFPGLLGREDRAITHPLPGYAVGAGGVADPGMPTCLAGVPQVVPILALQHGGAIDVIFPTRFLTWPEDNARWFGPVNAIFAVDNGE